MKRDPHQQKCRPMCDTVLASHIRSIYVLLHKVNPTTVIAVLWTHQHQHGNNTVIGMGFIHSIQLKPPKITRTQLLAMAGANCRSALTRAISSLHFIGRHVGERCNLEVVSPTSCPIGDWEDGETCSDNQHY